jgi:DNA repair exonuclease SbcCD ATPase subunit
MTIELANYILGIMLAIVGYFVKGLIGKVEDQEKRLNINEKTIEILATKHDGLDKRFDEINANLKELIRDVKAMPDKIKQTV